MPTRRRGEKSQRRRNARRNRRRLNPRRLTRLAIYLRDDFRCCYCNADLRHAPTGGITLDHVIPRCLGGSSNAENLVTACEPCNARRRNRLLSEYATAETRGHIFRQVGRAMDPYYALATTMLEQRRHAG